MRALQCSLKFVVHAFTTFNLAQAAERFGDLDLAIASYEQYLLLAPNAQDGDDVKDRIAVLKKRLASVEKDVVLPTKLANTPPTIAPPTAKQLPAAELPPASQTELVSSSAVTAPPTPTPSQSESQADESSTSAAPSSSRLRTAAWILLGGSGVLLGAATFLNISSRSKMDTCNAAYSTNPSIRSAACSDAKPLAYASYGTFAAGGAALAASVVTFVLPKLSARTSDVALNLLPEGGISLRVSGHF
jgi:cell division septum initiation protein DivIVA